MPNNQATAAWIFQCNPDFFDVDGYLAASPSIMWLAKQHADKMRTHQTVYFWRNAGKSKAIAGVVAVGTLTSEPKVQIDDAVSIPFWRDKSEASKLERRVAIRILEVATPKRVIRADWLKEDPICHDLPNLRMAQHTNYRLEMRHAQRLARLWNKTGNDFDRTDLLLSLRAYVATFGQPVSKLPGSPVAEAATVAGRAVSSIYAKVMNFRAQDPRVPGAGQANAGEPTKQVWSEYWTGSEINVAGLDAALDAVFTPGSDPESLKGLEAEADAFDGYSPEGHRRLVTHFRVERNRRVVEDAKAAWFSQDPYMPCCICKMSFLKKYGLAGKRFIEAHHKHRQVSKLDAPTIPRIEDFAPVCANCHRMLHHSEDMTIESIVRAIEDAKTEGR